MQRVLLAMSGGVDSTAAAILLCRAGYQVIGGTFVAFTPAGGLDADGCTPDAREAAQVCRALGIEHHVFDFREQFRRDVMDYFAAEYDAGRTPNPCVACNKRIKFGAFLAEADRLGCGLVATGHYARVIRQEGRFLVQRARDHKKDQSYMLWSLDQQQLGRVLLPLWELEKEEVRQIAAGCGLAAAHRAESQDICFIPDGDYAAFLQQHLGRDCPPGDFVDAEGRVLGRHRGIWHYTIGQRKGLGITFGKPMFVAAIDGAAGRIRLGEQEALLSREVRLGQVNYLIQPPRAPFEAVVRVRYSHAGQAAEVIPLADGGAQVLFREPVRAVTPGQSAVFYQGELMIGGGIIL